MTSAPTPATTDGLRALAAPIGGNIVARHSGKCLDVIGGTSATGNGARIDQFSCLGVNQDNQWWRLC